MKKILVKNIFLDAVFYTAGSVIYSIAVPMFIAPAHISPGGFTGIALIFNFLTGVPTGLMVFLLNIPVLAIAFKKFGAHFIIRTTIVTALVSALLDISEIIVAPFGGDRILSAIFGGILSGLGLSLVLLRGATTGGVDIIGKLINAKYPHISIGKIILISDSIVVIFSALCYRDISGALYSVVTMFISSTVLDKMLYGADKGKLAYIITQNGKEIAAKILKDVGRGVTKVEVQGAYSGQQREMLICAVRNHEVALLSNTVKNTDINAFIIICEAGEIHGYGFKN